MPIVKRPKASTASKYSATRLLSTLFFIVVSVIILCYLFIRRSNSNESAASTSGSLAFHDKQISESLSDIVNSNKVVAQQVHKVIDEKPGM